MQSNAAVNEPKGPKRTRNRTQKLSTSLPKSQDKKHLNLTIFDLNFRLDAVHYTGSNRGSCAGS